MLEAGVSWVCNFIFCFNL